MTRRHRGLSIVAAALAACAAQAPADAGSRTPATTTEETQAPEEDSVTMTDTRAFGRILGETARAVQKVHLQVLAREGTDFDSWVAYTLLAENDPAMPKEALRADLARRLDIEPSTTDRVLDRLVSAGHVGTRVDGGTELMQLTPAGTAYLRRVREAVNQASHRLVGHLDTHDLDTTADVLRAVGEAASALTTTTQTSR